MVKRLENRFPNLLQGVSEGQPRIKAGPERQIAVKQSDQPFKFFAWTPNHRCSNHQIRLIGNSEEECLKCRQQYHVQRAV